MRRIPVVAGIQALPTIEGKSVQDELIWFPAILGRKYTLIM